MSRGCAFLTWYVPPQVQVALSYTLEELYPQLVQKAITRICGAFGFLFALYLLGILKTQLKKLIST